MKFRNDPTMTWSSTDADGTPPGGVTVVNGENGEPPNAADLCLRFDAENVSLIELSRGTATTASAALLNGGGRGVGGVGGGGSAGDEKRSIGLIEAYSAAHVASGDKTATRAEFLRKNATGRDGSAVRGSRSALANGYAPEHHQPPPSLAIDGGDDHRASPARTKTAADRPSRVSNCVAGGQRLNGSEFAASLSASNGYVGPLSMSQVAPLDPRDSSSSSDSRNCEPSVPDESTPREEASGCSSSSSDEDGQQQLLRRERLRQTSSGDPSQTLAEEEEEVSASSETTPAPNDDRHDREDVASQGQDVSKVTTDSDVNNDAGDAPKTDDHAPPEPLVPEKKTKKAARKSVRFRDDDDLVDAAEEKAEDSDASSTRERPDGASSEESVDAEGGPATTHGDEENADDADQGEKKLSVPRGILKRPAEKGKQKNRVTFNELMTVFADGYPEVQVPAFRPWDLTDILCFAYEPPPGYRDWDSFDPPAEYMDLVEASIGVTTFHGEDDDVSDNPEGKISSEEMMEIYRTEFEYSADAVDEPNDFPVVKVDYAFDTTEILENQEIAPTSEDTEDESEKLETEEATTTAESPETVPEEPPEIVAPKAEEEDLGDESPLDSPVGDDDDSNSVEERTCNYGRSKHGAVTDNEDSGPDCDDLSGDDSKENSIVVSSKEMKPLELKSVESEAETSESVLTPTTEKELESGDEYHNATSKMMARTNSQIRKSIEMNALRRSLLKGSDVCRRRNPSGGSGPVIRPKSPTTSSLEEKLRWLTSTEDLTSAHDLESSERIDYSEIEEKQREEAATIELPSQGGPPTSVPSQGQNRQGYPPPHYIIQPRPTRWNSELLYTSPAPSASSASSSSSSTGSSYDNRPQLPSFRPPPSRPCSFDPTMGALAWEGYLQRDKYGYGGSSLSLMRAPYVCTVERHPNAANYPGHSDGGPNGSRGPRDPNNPTSDELEWFVQRDLERIERIKKRYSLTEEEDPTFGFGRRPSVRGIRPRFGSTSEILQQLQAQMRPPRPFSAANPRPPWPTVMANVGGPPRAQTLPRNHSSADGGTRLRPQGPPHQQQAHQQYHHQQPPRQQNYYGPPVQQPSQAIHPRTVVVLPRVSEEGGPLPHIVRVRSKHDHAFLIPNGVFFGHHKQHAGDGSNKDERGAPEGASSSPKVSSDSLFSQQTPPSRPPNTLPQQHQHQHQHQQQQQQQPATNTTDSNDTEAVIYYSLRV